jgi:hypothetical protein
MDSFHSPALEPVCEGLRSLFEPAADAPPPGELTRLIEALDEAYARGDLFADRAL